VHPKGLEPGTEYALMNPLSGETFTVAGSALVRDGFTLAIPKRPGVVWFYRRND
jgi:hypothetical protein